MKNEKQTPQKKPAVVPRQRKDNGPIQHQAEKRQRK